MPEIEVKARSLAGPGLPALVKLTLAAAGVLLVLAVYAPAAAGLLTAAAALAAVRYARRRWTRDRVARAYLLPVSDTIASPIGAPFRLFVSAELVGLPRTPRPLSPVEQAVRAWYGRRVEPVLRWPVDQAGRARATLARLVDPVTSRVRRPVDQRPAVRLVIERPYLAPDQRGYISSVINTKVQLGDVTETWHQIGPRVTATWTPRRRPPARVGVDQLREQLPQLAEWEFYLGQSAGGGPVVVSLRDDSPHICCSAGSGAGKSVLAQTVATQVLARGGEVVILDRKGSHRWARGIDGVTYCRTPAQMHTALVDVADLADQRNQQALDEEDDWDPGHRILVVAEELNATLGQLGDHWQRVRERGEPRQSPAITAFRELLYMGRSAKVNVLAIAQMLTARAVGGPEARENFAVRCLARYTSNAWRMLCPETSQPRPTRQLGRWQVVVAGTATETQICHLTAAQSRELARVPGRDRRSDRALSRDVPGDAHGSGDSGDLVDPLGDQLTLREAVAEGVLPWGHQAAKKRLQRSTNRPKPAGKRGLADVYTRAELIEWAERESSPAA